MDPFFVTLILIFVVALAIVWRQQTIHHYRRQLAVEATLRESEQRFRAMFENHGAIMLLIDPQGGAIFDANQAAVRFYGYAKTTLCSMNINQINRLTPEEVAAEFQRALREERNHFIFPHRLASGAERIVEVHSYPIPFQSKQVLFSIIHDVTERKRAESALRQSELLLHEAQSIADLGSWTADLRTNVFDASPEGARLMGWGPGAHTLDEIIEALHPEDREYMQSCWAAALAGAPYDIENRIILNGEVRWLHVKAKIARDQQGAPISALGITQDITARKQADEKLRQSEIRFRALIENAPGAIVLVGADGQTSFISSSTHRVMGYHPEMLGFDPASLTHPDDLAGLLELLADLMRRPGGVATAQYRFRHQDGSWRWVESTISNLLHEPSVNALAFNFQDISERKRAEQELLELNQTLEARVSQRAAEVQDLYENAPIGYHSLDAHSRLTMINQTELSWLGYTREEMIGRPISDFQTPASQLKFREIFPSFIERGWVKDLELEFIRSDGAILPALISATTIYDGDGAFMMSRTAVFDNTERKQAEEALRESEEQNRLLFEETPEAVILFDNAGHVLRMNRACERLTGYSSEQLTGHTLDELGLLSSSEFKQASAAVIESLKQHPGLATVEFKITRPDGELRDVGVRIFALKFRGHQHYLATMRDVTVEKQAEETLRRANAELARAARTKDEFLANMSHELRTPLNAILGFSESMQEEVQGPLNAPQLAALRNIEVSGRHLLALINDVLDLSKVEAGRLDLQVDSMSIHDICQNSLVFVKDMAAKKSLSLSLHLNDPLATVEADPKRLKQMLVNLLSNAVKFTPASGRVSLNVAVDVEAGAIHFAVQDTGIGIAPDDLALLFQPFRQLDSRLSRQHEGTGLGLALVRRLAELHGGSVTVESQVGVGSRFTIALPQRRPPTIGAEPAVTAPVEAPAPIAAAPERSPNARILLVEDNEINIMAIHDYLEFKGYRVIVAHDGREALDQVDSVRPDLILMDIQMPEIDGIEAIRRLRVRHCCATTPIIALTALAMPGDRERCLQAGANDYLTKPVRLKQLLATIEQLLYS